MAVSTTNALEHAITRTIGESFVELWEVRVTSSTAFRVTSWPENVSFSGNTYYSYPISRAALSRDSAGNLNQLSVSIANIDRAVQAQLESTSLQGRATVFTMFPMGGVAADAISETFEILSATADEAFVTLTLGRPNLLAKGFPARRFVRTQCGFVYGSADCGYDITRSGALATCDKSPNGSNGCIVHGTDEVSAGLPRYHPLRFGGFPSLLKGPYA